MISPSEKKKIINRLWLKYSYVVGRIVQKSIWQFEGTWHPSLINQFQDQFPEIDPDNKKVYVFVKKGKVEISRSVEDVIYQCSKARRFIDTLGADYSDFDLKKAYKLTKETIVGPIIRDAYYSDDPAKINKINKDEEPEDDLKEELKELEELEEEIIEELEGNP